MAKIGTISVIPKDQTGAFPSMDKSLRENGLSMFPGTFKVIYPYRELSGRWRTGLDPQAGYIKNIKDEAAKAAEIDRVTKLKKEYEAFTGLDLSPTSIYWAEHPVKLSDKDNFFNLDVEKNPEQAIAFAWIRVHPQIASSIEAYNRGEFLPETHFYVKDADIEEQLSYQKNKALNTAIQRLDSYSLEKRKKVARLVGLPISEDSKEEVVYNSLSAFIKEPYVKIGAYKEQLSIDVFNRFATLNDDVLAVKDVVERALLSQIYREGKTGRVYEGTAERFTSKDEMFRYFISDDHQTELYELEDRLKAKAITA